MSKIIKLTVAFIGFIAALITIITFLPTKKILPSQIEVTIVPHNMANESGAALYRLFTKTEFIRKKGSSGQFGIIVFVRPVPDPYFSLQCQGWPPQSVRYCGLNGKDVGKEECPFDPVYVGNGFSHRFQSQFEIYAVVLKRSIINDLMIKMPKDSDGLPFLDQISKIKDFDSEAIISSPVIVDVNWNALMGQR